MTQSKFILRARKPSGLVACSGKNADLGFLRERKGENERSKGERKVILRPMNGSFLLKHHGIHQCFAHQSVIVIVSASHLTESACLLYLMSNLCILLLACKIFSNGMPQCWRRISMFRLFFYLTSIVSAKTQKQKWLAHYNPATLPTWNGACGHFIYT